MLVKTNEWCEKCPIEQKILHCMQPGKFLKIYNPENPRLYSVVAVRSPIMDEMCKSNSDRISRPQPLNACYLGGDIKPGKSKSGKSRKKKPNLKRLKEDLWGT